MRLQYQGRMALEVSLLVLALVCLWWGLASPATEVPAPSLVLNPVQQRLQEISEGKWGVQPQWKLTWLSRAVQGSPRHCKVTCYWVGEPGVDHTTANGERVRYGGVAASPNLAFGTILFVEPRGFWPGGVFKVNDCGGALRSYWKKTGRTQLDVFMPRGARKLGTHQNRYWTEGDNSR